MAEDTQSTEKGFTVSPASDSQKNKIARARENQIRAAGGKEGLKRLEPILTPEKKQEGETGELVGKKIVQEVRKGNIITETVPAFGPGGSNENKPMFPPYPKQAPKEDEPGTEKEQ